MFIGSLTVDCWSFNNSNDTRLSAIGICRWLNTKSHMNISIYLQINDLPDILFTTGYIFKLYLMNHTLS